MAKAHLVLANGTKVDLEGTSDEVALLLAKCAGQAGHTESRSTSNPRKRPSKSAGQGTRRQGPVGFINELISEKFFKSKRFIADVQQKLEEKGHIYAQTSLSPALLHHVRKTKQLRRMKEKGAWVYVS